MTSDAGTSNGSSEHSSSSQCKGSLQEKTAQLWSGATAKVKKFLPNPSINKPDWTDTEPDKDKVSTESPFAANEGKKFPKGTPMWTPSGQEKAAPQTQPDVMAYQAPYAADNIKFDKSEPMWGGTSKASEYQAGQLGAAESKSTRIACAPASNSTYEDVKIPYFQPAASDLPDPSVNKPDWSAVEPDKEKVNYVSPHVANDSVSFDKSQPLWGGTSKASERQTGLPGAHVNKNSGDATKRYPPQPAASTLPSPSVNKPDWTAIEPGKDKVNRVSPHVAAESVKFDKSEPMFKGTSAAPKE